MSDVKSVFSITVTCSKTIPLLQIALIDWARSQDRKNWISYGYVNYFSGLNFFIHSREALPEKQIEEINKIVAELGCTIN